MDYHDFYTSKKKNQFNWGKKKKHRQRLNIANPLLQLQPCWNLEQELLWRIEK